MSRHIFVLLVGFLSILPLTSHADIVLDWNEAFRKAAKDNIPKSNPGWATRALAMTNGAIHDVFQATNRTESPFLVDTNAPGASRQAAVAQAAYTILQDSYDGQQAILDPLYADQMAAIPDGPAKLSGMDLGNQVAQQYINWRANDGANSSVPYTTSSDPGRWRPDPLHPDQMAWGPEWGAVQTFSLQHSGQFTLPGVPDLNSQQYTDAFLEVQELGAKDSATRTTDQTDMAHFWAYDRATMGPPPVMFNRNLHEIALQMGNSEEQNAQLFAMASVAMADAATAAWDAKFADDFWRPITGIREAGDGSAGDADGNPDTVADPNWTPLGAPGPDPNDWPDDFTPPFPAYPSGHATMGGALYETLRLFYATDSFTYDLTSEETMPTGNSTRTFSSFSEAEWENAMSRLYMGVHWRFDSTDGIDLGNQIAGYIFQNFSAQVVPEPSPVILSVIGLSLLSTLRRRQVC